MTAGTSARKPAVRNRPGAGPPRNLREDRTGLHRGAYGRALVRGHPSDRGLTELAARPDPVTPPTESGGSPWG